MTVQIPLGAGRFARVDDVDAPRILRFRWNYNPDHGEGRGYAQRNVVRSGKKTTEAMHTFLTGWPLVDHRDGDGLNNQRDNLRSATHGQNMANRRPNHGRRFKGAYPLPSGNWQARINVNKTRHYLGTFPNEESAARAYDVAALAAWGDYAYLNFRETSP
jgi:hypothetical protein